MAYNRLVQLTKEEANQLLQDYWIQRDFFLHELASNASMLGFEIPHDARLYRREHLLALGQFVESAIHNSDLLQFKPVEPWLAELLDPIDENHRFSESDIWLGIAVSYAFASVLLNTVRGAHIAIGNEKFRRYILQNQPVIKGKWLAEGVITDDSPLSMGKAIVRDLKDKSRRADFLQVCYDQLTQYAKAHDMII